jgi:hypothetical protein
MMVRKVPNDSFLQERTRLFFEMRLAKKGQFIKGDARIFDEFTLLVSGFWLLLIGAVTSFGFLWLPALFITLAIVTGKYFLLFGIAMVALDPMFGLPDFRSKLVPLLFAVATTVCFFTGAIWLALLPLAVAYSSGIRVVEDIIQLQQMKKLALTEHVYFHLMFKAGALYFKEKDGVQYHMEEPAFDVLSGRDPNGYMKTGIKAITLGHSEELLQADEKISEASMKRAQADQDLRDAIAMLKRTLKKGG